MSKWQTESSAGHLRYPSQSADRAVHTCLRHSPSATLHNSISNTAQYTIASTALYNSIRHIDGGYRLVCHVKPEIDLYTHISKLLNVLYTVHFLWTIRNTQKNGGDIAILRRQ